MLSLLAPVFLSQAPDHDQPRASKVEADPRSASLSVCPPTGMIATRGENVAPCAMIGRGKMEWRRERKATSEK